MIRDEIYKFFADYIFKNSGMVYSSNDYYRLESRLNELVKLSASKQPAEIFDMYLEIDQQMHFVLFQKERTKKWAVENNFVVFCG